MQCPKCSYQRLERDSHVMAGVCPACGIAYDKWRERLALEAERAAEAVLDSGEAGEGHAGAEWPGAVEGENEPLGQRFLHLVLFVPSDRHESAFWGHALIYALFFVWGWSFILGGIDWIAINTSFLHGPNLAFHEFGHVAFSPFGRFMTILGGSLFQVLLPLGLMGAFTLWQRDNFAASLMLWWGGQNCIDVSPYIADAVARAMPLVGGRGPEAHDWGNLLSMTGMLEQAQALAWTAFGMGAALIVLSNLWGAALLYIELRGRGAVGDEPL